MKIGLIGFVLRSTTDLTPTAGDPSPACGQWGRYENEVIHYQRFLKGLIDVRRQSFLRARWGLGAWGLGAYRNA
jgi:hypothetical protein